MTDITVFTPTYNRAHLLENVYDSLVKQTYQNFIWLIIDDGSKDNTKELVKKFIDENKIQIKYHYKENGGQHTALNAAISLADSKMLMIVDSDDYLIDNALERIMYWESTINDKSKFAGVSGLKMFPSNEQVGTMWSSDKKYIDATNLQRKEFGLEGDKAECYYLDILKKFYPIPVFEGENDVEKGVLWDRIAVNGYKIRWFNEKIYCCEYLEDGMSRNINANYLKNFKGYTYWKKELINIQPTIKRKLGETAFYIDVATQKGLTYSQMSYDIEQSIIFLFLAKIYGVLRCIKNKMKKY